MVEIKRGTDEAGFEWIRVKSPKQEAEFVISKTENGFSQYSITLTQGSAPAALSGVYTTPDFALKCVLKHLENKRWTQAAKNRETAKRVSKRKAANGKLQSNSKDTV